MQEEDEEKEFIKTYAQSYGYNGGIDGIREKEFARLKGEVYLDHAGATQYPQSLLEKYFQDLSSNVYGNPHSRNPSSHSTTEAINEIRNKILRHFNTNSDEYSVIFTAGTTASLKLVAECFDWHGRSSEKLSSSLCFFQNCHTSVIGMREVALSHGARVLCIKDEDLFQSEKCQQNGPFRSNDSVNVIQHNNSSTTQCSVDETVDNTLESCSANLFVFPAMCNFSGRKYPLKWIMSLQNGVVNATGQLLGCHNKWYVMLDAASFVSTSHLDLQRHQPDFIPVSFYKIFGFPTGLGALLVQNKSVDALKKKYYGGGTVLATISSERFHVLKPNISERFEDGTVAFLDVIALGHAFDCLYQMTGSMQAICEHTFSIAQFVYKKMDCMTHGNGRRVCKLYCATDFENQDLQGPVINFNLMRSDGTMVGYGEIDKFACLFNIHLRTGSFCNTGASQQHLGLSNAQLKKNYAAGHVCGDNVDLIDGIPTGSVRISFGYMSTFSDAQRFLKFIRDCFIEKEAGIPSGCHNIIRSSKSMTFDDVPMIEEKGSLSLRGSGSIVENGIEISEKMKDFQASNDGCHSSLTLLKICIFPIKSCGAFEVLKWEIEEKGLKYDRQWMIINEAKICLSQKRESKLCLIQPSIDLENKLLIVNAPGMPSLYTGLDMNLSEVNKYKVKIGMEWVKEVLDCGDKAAKWLTSFLGKKCRLVQQNPEETRISKITPQGCKEVEKLSSLSLANVSQYLLLSRASVTRLHQQIMESSEKSTKKSIDDLISRFRGNLIIDGMTAFEEDSWKQIKIGQHLFQFQGLCSRCQMICLNQKTAERTVEPLKTLGVMRGSKTGTFGIGLQHLVSECDNCQGGNQLIQVGDPVIIV